MLKPIVTATAIAGTLDILAAFILAGLNGVSPVQVLQFVASGPFGDVTFAHPAYAAAGLLVHFAIMACMAAAYFLASTRLPILRRSPVRSGVIYGLLLWFVMYWIVMPMRWPDNGVPSGARTIAAQLFCHIVLVGIPIALVAARFHNRRRT